jgi:hypothetical protein
MKRNSKGGWVSMKPVTKPRRMTDDEIRNYCHATGSDETEFRAALDTEYAVTEYFINDIYQVARRPVANGFVQLNIRRRDGKTIFRDWRHFQNIKNELIGPDCEAIELYPAESRKVDTGNKYHLWCCPDPNWRFPVGWVDRDVQDDKGDRPAGAGFRQRAGTENA